MTDDKLQDAALAELTTAPNYQRWLAGLALPHLGDHPIEIGAGLGDYAMEWLRDGVPEITLTEADVHRRHGLEARFANDPRVHVADVDLLKPSSASYSAMVSFNVFEHIEQDAKAFAGAHALLRSGGTVFTLVPAFPFAYSRFDREIGHHRRYTRTTLERALLDAGLVDVRTRYLNAPGLIAWFFGMRVLRMRPVGGAVGLWDKAVVPVVSTVEARVQMPFGQSCIGIAKVP